MTFKGMPGAPVDDDGVARTCSTCAVKRAVVIEQVIEEVEEKIEESVVEDDHEEGE